MRRDRLLPRMRTRIVNARIERHRCSLERFQSSSRRRHRRHASSVSRASKARPPTACMAWVPLRSARPSFASRVDGSQAALASSASATRQALAVEETLRLRRSASARDAPAARDRRWPRPSPFSGITGCTPRFSISTSSSMTSSRIPLNPSVSTLARSNIIARTSGIGKRRADAAGMAAHEIQLQLAKLVRCESERRKAFRSPC